MQAKNNDLAKIHRVIGRARRRLRMQAALEWATTAAILAVAGSLVLLWLFRMRMVAREDAILVLCGLGGGVLLAGIGGTLRRWPTTVVASRIDRASGLADRLGTACEFDRRLRDGQLDKEHPETAAMMQAAIDDGLTSVARANVKAAAPFKAPRDLRAFVAFAAVACAVALLAWKPADKRTAPNLPLVLGANGNGGITDKAAADDKGLDHEDMNVTREYLDDLKSMAEQTGDPHLQQFANDLEALLEKAERGEISKEELLAKLAELEKKYMEGADQKIEEIVQDLKDTGKDLKKEPMTRRLGEALEQGDMQAAKQELERLADEMENGKLSEKEQKKLADALDRAEKKREEREQKEQAKKDAKDPKAQEQKKKEDEVRRLEKKLKDDPNDEETKRRLEKEKRELERLEREKNEKNEQAKKRRLERLHRDMKQTSEDLKNKKEKAPRTMREAAEDAQGVEDEIRKIQNQQKAQSQLGDLKEAIRRAKPKKGQGQGQGQGRAQRIRDFARRAGGGRGNGQAWKPGQGQGQGKGQNGQNGQNGNKPGQGGGLGGNSYGDQHDPNLMGDATKGIGKTKDEQLTGKKGSGPSRKQTILTSAKQGFASVKYKQIHAQYKKVAEDVMKAEKVPQGYRYYVRRYFNQIKPHKMD